MSTVSETHSQRSSRKKRAGGSTQANAGGFTLRNVKMVQKLGPLLNQIEACNAQSQSQSSLLGRAGLHSPLRHVQLHSNQTMSYNNIVRVQDPLREEPILMSLNQWRKCNKTAAVPTRPKDCIPMNFDHQAAPWEVIATALLEQSASEYNVLRHELKNFTKGITMDNCQGYQYTLSDSFPALFVKESGQAAYRRTLATPLKAKLCATGRA